MKQRRSPRYFVLAGESPRSLALRDGPFPNPAKARERIEQNYHEYAGLPLVAIYTWTALKRTLPVYSDETKLLEDLAAEQADRELRSTHSG